MEGSGYNELCSSEEGSKVAVKVVLLLAGLAAGRRPQLNGVCGNAHKDQAPRGGYHQYQAAQYDQRGTPHTEGTPGGKEKPQCILKAFTQRFTAGCIYYEEKGTESQFVSCGNNERLLLHLQCNVIIGKTNCLQKEEK